MKSIFYIPLLFLVTSVYCQQIGQVTFSGGSRLTYFSFITDQGVLIRVTDDGKVMEWGTELMAQRSDYFAPKLQPYLGRVEYYGPESDSAYKSKIKSIGTCVFTYYSHYETVTKVGKLRTVGTLILDYFDNFDIPTLRGKLRFVGNQVLEYFSPTVDEAYRGKLKSIGNTPITYFSSFDDKAIKGKIKSIGPVNYTWYTSFDINRNGLKTGLYRQNIGGITYILQ